MDSAVFGLNHPLNTYIILYEPAVGSIEISQEAGGVRSYCLARFLLFYHPYFSLVYELICMYSNN